MINESPKDVRAYWFFTPYTIPDKRMLDLLGTEKHEVALHVVNRPFEEAKDLEEKTGRKIQYTPYMEQNGNSQDGYGDAN
jgi:hypothetical protein